MLLDRRLRGRSNMLNVAAVLALVVVSGQNVGSVGRTVSQNGIHVTLLAAERLSLDAYRAALAPDAVQWDGGGFYFAFFVENRPSAPMPPALGEVRVVVGGQRYNAVTNATSSKPFAPSVIIRTVEDAIARDSNLRTHMPVPHAGAVGSVLQVYVPGKSIAPGTSGEVTLEMGETHRPAADGRLRALSGTEMMAAFIPFRSVFSTP